MSLQSLTIEERNAMKKLFPDKKLGKHLRIFVQSSRIIELSPENTTTIEAIATRLGEDYWTNSPSDVREVNVIK